MAGLQSVSAQHEHLELEVWKTDRDPWPGSRRALQ